MINDTSKRLTILIAQLNPIMGDLAGNAHRLLQIRRQERKADLIVTSELYLCAYPPEDLVLKPAFQQACREYAEKIAKETLDGGPAILLGLPWLEHGKLYNAYALLENGAIATVRLKYDLPNYGVFDEKRVFSPGPWPEPIEFRGIKFGVPICEDIWQPHLIKGLSEAGAEFFIVPNGSPYETDKLLLREQLARQRIMESGKPLLYLNQIGGQDEVVFDGASFAVDRNGKRVMQAPAFEEALISLIISFEGGRWDFLQGELCPLPEKDEADYCACVLGLRDYVTKNGFSGVVLGLSGGIDSALATVMAVDALGPEPVHAFMLPYRYTTQQSLDDAKACADALAITYKILPIAPAVVGLEAVLQSQFKDLPADSTEENLQSRSRGSILMAISNKFNLMVVTTGNKSEMAVGYATLYGDMNGGYNPLKDLYKSQVFRLARLRNHYKPEMALGPKGIVIPSAIITRAPSAELRENQTDQDNLPPYSVLDDILHCLIEKEMPLAQIVARGYDVEIVKKVERLLYLAEYKRHQAAPGVKVSSRNFGRDRRYPMVNHFRE